MPTPDQGTGSLLHDLASLSLSPRKRREDSIKEPDLSSRFSQWISRAKAHPNEARRHRSHVAKEEEDIEGGSKDWRHESKLLRRELAALKRDRDELDEQRHKTTADLKRLREKYRKTTDKLDEYRLQFQDQDVALDRERASVQILRGDVSERDGEIDQLTKDCTKAKSRLQRTRDKLDRERVEVSRLNKGLLEIKTQKYPSSENQDALSSLQALRAKHDDIQRKLTASLEEIKTLSTENGSLEEYCTRLKGDRDDIRQRLSREKAQNAAQTHTLLELMNAKTNLEKSRNLLQPIVQIGVDIRLRNLETAREIILKIKQGEKDRAILLSGNVAAHRANGAVDAALFVAGLIPEDYLPEATKVFKKLYQVSPADYGCWSPMVLRMIDCQATIATVQVQHHFKKFDTTHLRNEHDRLHGFLLSRRKRLSSGEFEGDPKAKELLSRIEDIMEEIVDLSRGKGKGRKIFQPFEYEDSEVEGQHLKFVNGSTGVGSVAASISEVDDDSEESDSSDIDDPTEEEEDSSDVTAETGEDSGESGSGSEDESEVAHGTDSEG
ncbi:uncharacterized protein RSE6_11572 [Rhynchosporium secalis]|uniref:Uncharacterized protein n=1 Tax=Rhynchosporium secalis TaxID=38038 RepID=A0A1E1MN95_RHYSE|nr:uncharacterized protein RSE6_11572 [Rhynchosporium secalis]